MVMEAIERLRSELNDMSDSRLSLQVEEGPCLPKETFFAIQERQKIEGLNRS